MVGAEARDRADRGRDHGGRLAGPGAGAIGREPTSIAFLSTAGTERLYSGVTKSTASAEFTWLRKRVQAAGGEVVSRSWL